MVHFSTIVRLIPMVLLLLLTAEATSNATNTSPALAGVGLDQKLNAQIPLDLSFTDDTGSRVSSSSTLVPSRSCSCSRTISVPDSARLCLMVWCRACWK